MTEDELRAAMRKRFESMTAREWCMLNGVTNTHVSDFLHGRRRPPPAMLRALNMRIDYVKIRKSKDRTHG